MIRWYGDMFWWQGAVGKVQMDDRIKDYFRHHPTPEFTLPEQVLRLAQEEYDRQHPGQPYERMQQRGGLSLLEVVALLADHVERLKAAQKSAASAIHA